MKNLKQTYKKNLIETRNYNISLSDIDYIFNEALTLSTEKEISNYIFENLSELPNDLIVGLWESFLDYNEEELDEEMQGGMNMSSILPYNKRITSKTELEEK